ncbi:MAG: conjugal transfer protein TraX [Oscillospiraceae bacterium]|nr:conjugal transfer protein TraX [Oscillospiraceae bacterium]
MDESSVAYESSIKKYRILSGSALKMIALITMIIDHVGYFIISRTVFGMEPLFTVGSIAVTLYWIFRKIGRLAFPIYVFLLSEGFLHSRNRTRYALGLFIFALLSEIPWNIAHSGKIFLITSQNVFFTLFLGLLAIMFSNRFRETGKIKFITAMFAVFAAAYFLKADYGIRGVGFALIVYLLRDHRVEQALAGSSIYVNNAPAFLISFLIMNMYNGRRGFIQSKVLKYAFYFVYPLHILLLWYIGRNL